jgi:hypothetical protein
MAEAFEGNGLLIAEAPIDPGDYERLAVTDAVGIRGGRSVCGSGPSSDELAQSLLPGPATHAR